MLVHISATAFVIEGCDARRKHCNICIYEVKVVIGQFVKVVTTSSEAHFMYRQSCGIPGMGSLSSDSEWELGTWGVKRTMSYYFV
jgi:hypothetical protein